MPLVLSNSNTELTNTELTASKELAPNYTKSTRILEALIQIFVSLAPKPLLLIWILPLKPMTLALTGQTN